MELRVLSLDLIDIGANLAHESFAPDVDDVIARAHAAGVRRMIVTGADVAGSRHACALAAANPGRLWSTAGVHPHHAQDFTPAQRPELMELLRRPQVVAVGDCGLE